MAATPYYYSQMDGVTLTHGGIDLSEFYPRVRVRLERATDNGFHFAECWIPFFCFDRSYGFSEDELFELEEYIKRNDPLITKLAQLKGGADFAQGIA